MVHPFKQPVGPYLNQVPDYFEKVTTPMDLGAVKEKMNRGEYASEEEVPGGRSWQIWNRLYLLAESH